MPAFDSPSVFGSLLDRQAGFFRLRRRSGSTIPPRARYEPGTNVLVTTWKTPTGWIVVRDALTMGPRDHEDEVTPHTRPPADDDGDHMLVRTVECLEGRVEVELVCEPVFDYGRDAGRVDARRRRPARRRRERRRPDDPAASRTSRSASRATASAGAHTLAAGDRAYCALSWAEELAAPADVDEADARIAATARFWRGLARPRAHPRPPLRATRSSARRSRSRA